MSFNLNLDLVKTINGVPLSGMPLSSIFSIDDRFRTRSLSTLLTANFDGEKFQGVLTDLEPGVGYEVFVAKNLTFNYAIYNRSADWLQ